MLNLLYPLSMMMMMVMITRAQEDPTITTTSTSTLGPEWRDPAVVGRNNFDIWPKQTMADGAPSCDGIRLCPTGYVCYVASGWVDFSKSFNLEKSKALLIKYGFRFNRP